MRLALWLVFKLSLALSNSTRFVSISICGRQRNIPIFPDSGSHRYSYPRKESSSCALASQQQTDCQWLFNMLGHLSNGYVVHTTHLFQLLMGFNFSNAIAAAVMAAIIFCTELTSYGWTPVAVVSRQARETGAPFPLSTSDQAEAAMNLSDDDIKGETEVFPIDIKGPLWRNPKFMVGGLKEKIQEKRKDDSLAGVDALWKVRAIEDS